MSQADLVFDLVVFVVLVSVSMQGFVLLSVLTASGWETISPLGSCRPGTTAQGMQAKLIEVRGTIQDGCKAH